MSTPAEIQRAIGASGPPAALPQPAEQTVRAGRRWAMWVFTLADPEWLVFLVVLLLPALVALVLGSSIKVSFFLGAAVYVAVLRWLGWAVFGRWTAARSRYLLFAAEVFAGLAVVCAWFYLRNLIAKVWPGSYGLGELAWLFPALLVLHVADLIRRAPSLLASLRMSLAALGPRLAIYAPFAALLTAALWWMSAERGVQGTDAMTHTFMARIYRTEGIDFAVPPTNRPIVYPSPFGAMNATAAAIAPLSVLQAFHLQHVLLFITALFLIAGTVAVWVGRPLPLLHSLPVLFLFLFPLYAIYPDVLYPGTPKQAGPPLCVAVCLLPLLAPTGGRWAFIVAIGVVGMLTVLAGALNPACAPYALVSAIVAAVVFAARGRAALGVRRWQSLAVQFGLTLAAAAMVISCDLYYRSLLHSPVIAATDARPRNGAVPGKEEMPVTPAPRFSWRKGLAGMGSVNPLGLSPVETATGLLWDRAEHLRGWDERWLPRIATIGVLLLSLFALAGLLPRRSRSAAVRDPLVRFLLAAVLVWLALKYLMTFALTGLSRGTNKTLLLSIYMRFVLLRCELLLLFACLVAAGARLYLARPPARATWLLAVVGIAVCWLLPALGLAAGVEVSGFPMVPTTDRFGVTDDDLKLTAWLDEHVPPEKGTIGLAAFTFTAGPHGEEHHIYPLSGGHALALYGRHYNFRFFLPSLEGDGGAAYAEHVSGGLAQHPQRNRGFDADWCLRKNIRYFYVNLKELSKNPALAEAIDRGTLVPVVQFGDSVLYEVRL